MASHFTHSESSSRRFSGAGETGQECLLRLPGVAEGGLVAMARWLESFAPATRHGEFDHMAPAIIEEFAKAQLTPKQVERYGQDPAQSCRQIIERSLHEMQQDGQIDRVTQDLLGIIAKRLECQQRGSAQGTERANSSRGL